jgi:hypothetical protein
VVLKLVSKPILDRRARDRKEPLEGFLYCINSNAGEQRYMNRLVNSFDCIGTVGDVETQQVAFEIVRRKEVRNRFVEKQNLTIAPIAIEINFRLDESSCGLENRSS